jgi:hypothetical protein
VAFYGRWIWDGRVRNAAALHLVCAIDRLAWRDCNEAGRVRTIVIADPAKERCLSGDGALLLHYGLLATLIAGSTR